MLGVGHRVALLGVWVVLNVGSHFHLTVWRKLNVSCRKINGHFTNLRHYLWERSDPLPGGIALRWIFQGLFCSILLKFVDSLPHPHVALLFFSPQQISSTLHYLFGFCLFSFMLVMLYSRHPSKKWLKQWIPHLEPQCYCNGKFLYKVYSP